MTSSIETLLEQLTLAEKVSLLAGANMWQTVAIERLGIPAIHLSDGPNGVRGNDRNAGDTSACFPAGVAMGATWNPALIQEVGRSLGEEARTLGVHVLLAPTVNIHRSPIAGRNFECFSEDPHLTGRLASAYIQGVQSQGVSSCIKHFVCNDSEFERQSISSEVAPRPLREIYLRPFEMALNEARPWSLMSAYNRINGIFASENDTLLGDLLKEEWGFDGLVVSDWYGTYGPGATRSALDLEMPGPGRWLAPEKVLAALEAGHIDDATVDDKVRRLLRLMERTGALAERERPATAVDLATQNKLARQTAVEAMVLLKNESACLPLEMNEQTTIAVIGENARWAQIMGGGSSAVPAHYAVSPLAGIQAHVAGRCAVEYAVGCLVHRSPPAVPLTWLATPAGKPGLQLEYFNNANLAGPPIHTATATHSKMSWFGDIIAAGPASIRPDRLAVRLTGTITPPEDGIYTLSLMSIGLSRLLIDDEVAIDNWSGQETTTSREESRQQFTRHLTGGQAYRLEVTYTALPDTRWQPLELGCLPPLPADTIQAAVDLATRATVAVVVAGLTMEWEGEGFDRADMRLPADQDELIHRVAAVNPNTIVVLNTGSPVEMPWLDDVPAVLQMWYGGQEMGHALADILFGQANPSGRLPTTFPRRLADNPAYINYPGENGRVFYGEGLFVGYRYYDKKDIDPLFPFGHGLSYTRFNYTNLRLSDTSFGPGQELLATVDVTNRGQRAGQEVVQLYLQAVAPRLARPLQELKAFAKVHLEPGETKAVTLTLTGRDLAFYDPAVSGWLTEPGDYIVHVGSSSRKLPLHGRFTWRGKSA